MPGINTFSRSHQYAEIGHWIKDPDDRLCMNASLAVEAEKVCLVLRFALIGGQNRVAGLKAFSARSPSSAVYHIGNTGDISVKGSVKGYPLNKMSLPIYTSTVPPFVAVERVCSDSVATQVEAMILSVMETEGVVCTTDIRTVLSFFLGFGDSAEYEKDYCFKTLAIDKALPPGSLSP